MKSTIPESGSGVDGATWERVVYGIEVLDESGTPIDHPFLGGFNLPRPLLTDVDGDSDLDLFIQELSNEIIFFENVGTEGASEYRWVTDSFHCLASKAVRTVQKFSDAQVCAIRESACVVYASSMRDYARDTRRPSVLMHREWFETAHVNVRPPTSCSSPGW